MVRRRDEEEVQESSKKSNGMKSAMDCISIAMYSGIGTFNSVNSVRPYAISSPAIHLTLSITLLALVLLLRLLLNLSTSKLERTFEYHAYPTWLIAWLPYTTHPREMMLLMLLMQVGVVARP
jgi:hypothetical protein